MLTPCNKTGNPKADCRCTPAPSIDTMFWRAVLTWLIAPLKSAVLALEELAFEQFHKADLADHGWGAF